MVVTIGVIIWLAFFLVLAVWHINIRYGKSEVETKLPVCACSHHLCYHDKNGCGASFCGCKKYIQKDTPENVALYGDELK